MSLTFKHSTERYALVLRSLRAKVKACPQPQRVEPIGTVQKFSARSSYQPAAAGDSRAPGAISTAEVGLNRIHAVEWGARSVSPAVLGVPPKTDVRPSRSIIPCRRPGFGPVGGTPPGATGMVALPIFKRMTPLRAPRARVICAGGRIGCRGPGRRRGCWSARLRATGR